VTVGGRLEQDQRVRVRRLDGVLQRDELALEVGPERDLRSVYGVEVEAASALELARGGDQQARAPGAERLGGVGAGEVVGLAEDDLLVPAAVGDRRLERQIRIVDVGQVRVHALGDLHDRAGGVAVVRDHDRVVVADLRRALEQQPLRERREPELAGLQDDRAHRQARLLLGAQDRPQLDLRGPEHERDDLAPVDDLQRDARVEGVVLDQPAADRLSAQNGPCAC
jgi:hypothetical protein